MTEFLATTVDKFIFKVAADRYYSREGLWVQLDGPRVRIGLSDFVQQRNGDVAFAEVKPVSTTVAAGEEVASIETIKVTISFSAPVSGTIIEINPAMADAPEAINQDPYGKGWLAVIEAGNWDAERAALLDPQAYLALVKGQAEEEVNKP